MIDSIRRDTGHSVRVICSVLDVPRSSYYHAAAPTPTQRSDQEIGDVVEEVFKSHQGRYGHRRISAELVARLAGHVDLQRNPVDLLQHRQHRIQLSCLFQQRCVWLQIDGQREIGIRRDLPDNAQIAGAAGLLSINQLLDRICGTQQSDLVIEEANRS